MSKGLVKFLIFIVLTAIAGGLYYRYRITHSLEQQIELFKINNEATRQRAVAYLVRQGKHSIPYLISALESNDSQVRINAVRALGRIDEPNTIDPLINRITDADQEVQYEVLEALENRGKKIITRLVKSLESSNHKMRAKITELIGRIADPESIDIVKQVLNDSSPEVRAQAVIAMRWVAKEKSIELIYPMLRDSDTNVRMMVVFALGEFKHNPDARRALEGALSSSDDQLREKAIQFLGESEHPDVEDALIKALGDKELKVRWVAAEALGKTGGMQSLGALRKVILKRYEVEFVKSSAKNAIKKIRQRLRGKNGR